MRNPKICIRTQPSPEVENNDLSPIVSDRLAALDARRSTLDGRRSPRSRRLYYFLWMKLQSERADGVPDGERYAGRHASCWTHSKVTHNYLYHWSLLIHRDILRYARPREICDCLNTLLINCSSNIIDPGKGLNDRGKVKRVLKLHSCFIL